MHESPLRQAAALLLDYAIRIMPQESQTATTKRPAGCCRTNGYPPCSRLTWTLDCEAVKAMTVPSTPFEITPLHFSGGGS